MSIILRENDFFCGAGGMGLGFKQAGFRVAGAWDFDKFAVQSYSHNVSPKVKQADVTLMNYKDVPYADVWTFGAPCQAYSIAGEKLGMTFKCTSCEHEEIFDGELIIDQNTNCSECGEKSNPKDPRGIIFFHIMRLLKETKENIPENLPPIIMLENVKGVKKFLGVFEKEYAKRGYKMYHTLYNSKYQGVPQNRERYFVIGVHESIEKEFVFKEQQTDFVPKLSSVLEKDVPEKFYMNAEKAKRVIEEALKRVELTGTHACLTPDRPKRQNGPRAKEEEKEMFTLTAQDKHGIIIAGNLGHYNNDQMNRVYDPEGISPTLLVVSGGGREIKILEAIQGVFTDKDGAAYCCDANYYKGIGKKVGTGRRTQIIETGFRVRRLTPREYARLQGFPDTFEFVVSDSQLYKQFGNAVTVTVSRSIARQIKHFLLEVAAETL